jgi:hypothetical protein
MHSMLQRSALTRNWMRLTRSVCTALPAGEDAKMGNVAKYIGSLWSTESEEGKHQYDAQIEKEMAKYYIEMKKYKPDFKEPKARSGGSRKRGARDSDDEGSDSGSSGSSDSEAVGRATMTSDRPKRGCAMGKSYSEDTKENVSDTRMHVSGCSHACGR